MNDYTARMVTLLKAHGVEVLNVSDRHAVALVARSTLKNGRMVAETECIGINAAEIRNYLGY